MKLIYVTEIRSTIVVDERGVPVRETDFPNRPRRSENEPEPLYRRRARRVGFCPILGTCFNSLLSPFFLSLLFWKLNFLYFLCTFIIANIFETFLKSSKMFAVLCAKFMIHGYLAFIHYFRQWQLLELFLWKTFLFNT